MVFLSKNDFSTIMSSSGISYYKSYFLTKTFSLSFYNLIYKFPSWFSSSYMIPYPWGVKTVVPFFPYYFFERLNIESTSSLPGFLIISNVSVYLLLNNSQSLLFLDCAHDLLGLLSIFKYLKLTIFIILLN